MCLLHSKVWYITVRLFIAWPYSCFFFQQIQSPKIKQSNLSNYRWPLYIIHNAEQRVRNEKRQQALTTTQTAVVDDCTTFCGADWCNPVMLKSLFTNVNMAENMFKLVEIESLNVAEWFVWYNVPQAKKNDLATNEHCWPNKEN